MVNMNNTTCPNCGGDLKYYDKVRRIVRTKGRVSKWMKIRRLRCVQCHILHRELPECVYPYKQYEIEVIVGVRDGFIRSDTYGYEDYPCELTMIRWKMEELTNFPPSLFLQEAHTNLE